MSKHAHSNSVSFVSVNLVVFSLLIVSISGQTTDFAHPSCPAAFDCNNVTFRYPFWRIVDEPTPQFCGYRGFGINCFSVNSGVGNISSIALGADSYYVKNINYESRSIVLVDNNLVNNSSCPRVTHNIVLETLPLNFSTFNVNLSFHFNCTGGTADVTPIRCLDYNERRSFVNIASSELENFDWDCEQEVVTTVYQDADLQLPSLWETALSRGFELNWWREDECEKCEDSYGRCGRHNATGFICFCPNGVVTTGDCNGSSTNFSIKMALGIGTSLLLIVVFVIIFCNYVAAFVYKADDHHSVEAFFIQYGSLTMKRYTYHDIKKMSKSFQVKLGQGGFGTVYKGKLSDGRLVAIKVLNTTKASGQEFINEVASVGRTSHVNIVTLLGFCFEYKKRALVYEFMPNGSLEKFIHSSTNEHIGVHKLYEISLGVARGLDYLHRGCNTRILHLDIKPHNILLDEDFCPKITDFGLAKLYSRKESIVSMLEARGTIGYIAPEVFNRNFGGVSHKSDVYSYGMLILEMVGGRKNVDAGVGSSEIYFPHWIYNRLEKDEFLLESITTPQENDYARKMTIVGLWCIQTDPNQRPSINEVIEMLEGSLEALQVPPRPFFSSLPLSPTITLVSSESETA